MKDDRRLFFEIQLNFSHISVQDTFFRHNTVFMLITSLFSLATLWTEFFLSTKIRQMKAGQKLKYIHMSDITICNLQRLQILRRFVQVNHFVLMPLI